MAKSQEDGITILLGLKGQEVGKVRKPYRQESREEATRTLDNIIFNLKLADGGELIWWGNSLKRWREPILNHFDNRTTNALTCSVVNRLCICTHPSSVEECILYSPLFKFKQSTFEFFPTKASARY